MEHAAADKENIQFYKRRVLDFIVKADHYASQDDLEDSLDQTLDLIVECVGGEACVLYIVHPGDGEILQSVTHGAFDDLDILGLPILEEQGIVGGGLLLKECLVKDNLSNYSPWLGTLEAGLASGLSNVIAVPIAYKENVIGTVQVYNFSEREPELLQILASRLALIMEKLVLLEGMDHSYKRFKHLVEVIGRVSANLDRNQLLKDLTNYVYQLVDSERSSVFLVDPTTNELTSNVSFQASNGDESNIDKAGPLSRLEVIFNNGNRNGFSNNIPASRSRKRLLSGELGAVTGSAVTVPLRTRAISLGQRGRLEERVIGGLMATNRENQPFGTEDTRMLKLLASHTSTMLQISELYSDASDLFLDTIKALVAAIDAKDPYTQGHSMRVSEISVVIAEQLGLDDRQVHHIRIGSLLHDVGKIGIPDKIISKPLKLTDEEFAIIKKHPEVGNRIMSEVKLLHDVLPAIYEHHERLDGSGYPLGLIEGQISLMGRIVAVADVYDALTSDRPYRKALSIEYTRDYLEEKSGSMFDERCVQACLLTQELE
jgi:putative nucleotidyltransferase with HDIG domain